MANYTEVIKKYSTPYLSALKDDYLARRDKTFFWATGTQVYCGKQGSGKTISAVSHVLKLKNKYPLSILVSNLRINGLQARTFHSLQELRLLLNTSREGVEDSTIPPFNPETQYILFASMEALTMLLVEVNNGFKGVIYLIDEIHTYFNSLESKNIPMFIFTEISQQRKQRKLIIGTSQVFNRMAKPFREQCDNIIFCNTIMGFFTIQSVFEGDISIDDETGKPKQRPVKTGWFFHNRPLRNSFDTYQKVVSANEQYQSVMILKESENKKNSLFYKKGK